jgi:hypothetical protein
MRIAIIYIYNLITGNFLYIMLQNQNLTIICTLFVILILRLILASFFKNLSYNKEKLKEFKHWDSPYKYKLKNLYLSMYFGMLHDFRNTLSPLKSCFETPVEILNTFLSIFMYSVLAYYNILATIYILCLIIIVFYGGLI